jgi:hypothetical protein
MSFYTGTQTELLYAMPGSGGAVTTSQTLLSLNSTSGIPYQLPGGYFTQQSGTGTGKSLLIKGGGNFTTSSTSNTLLLAIGIDSTAGTLNALAQTGAFIPAVSVTNGAFEFECLVTCQLLGSGAGTKLAAVGHLFIGAANNTAVPTFTSGSGGGTGGAGVVMIGAPQTAVAITNSAPYFIEVFATWSATTGSPTITMTNFLVFGLN